MWSSSPIPTLFAVLLLGSVPAVAEPKGNFTATLHSIEVAIPSVAGQVSGSFSNDLPEPDSDSGFQRTRYLQTHVERLSLTLTGVSSNLFRYAIATIKGVENLGKAVSWSGFVLGAQTATTESKSTVSDADNLRGVVDSHDLAGIKKLALSIFNLGGLRNMVFSVPLWVALILTLTLERIIPAEPNRNILSASFAHDVMWFLYEPILHALVVGSYVGLAAKIYRAYFSHLTFSGLTAAPGWIRFAVAVLVLDLGYWIQHYVNHKVPYLWKLHSVHHSQQQLNFFTDFRYHPLEYVVRHTFITIPFLFFSVAPPAVVGFAVFKEWYSRFYHGNIRTNLGPLKYILVTPQSHRVHHSLEARHHDRNFGAIFSFWDFLFLQQYKGFDEYPATGLDEEHFPKEEKISLKSLFLTPWLQMLRPFSRRPGPGAS